MRSCAPRIRCSAVLPGALPDRLAAFSASRFAVREGIAWPRQGPAMPSRPAEEGVGGGSMAAFAGNIGLHPGDLLAQLVDVVAQFLDPERVQDQFLQPRALAWRRVVVIACHRVSFPRTGLSS